MSKVSIRMDTDNAVFRDESGRLYESEVSRILREVADRVESGERKFSFRDYNGNTVGDCRITGK